MPNEEVFQRAHEEFTLRGLSPNTADEYLRALWLFLRYYDNHPIETMGEPEIREFLLHQINLGKATGSVNIYQQRSAVYLWRCAAAESQLPNNPQTSFLSRVT